MKIAFVNDLFERFGPEYISALLKANGHCVRLFLDPRLFDDGEFAIPWLARSFDYRKRLVSELQAFRPDLIAFSIATDSYQWALGMASMIKAVMNVPIILGGIHPTSVPERVLNNECVDMVCVGEGEYAMLDLVNSMEKGAVDYAIPNIWFKRDGKVISNDVRPLISDLDTLPRPDKDLFYSISPYLAATYSIITSRGCVNACSYCCHSYLKDIYQHKGKYLRQRSINNIIAELDYAKSKYNIKMIRFWDDDFLVARDEVWFRDFAQKYKSRIGLPFICYLYPHDISEAVVACLKDAGCCEIIIGIQSWDDNLRKGLLFRNTPNTVIEHVIDLFKKNKIRVTMDFICGMPGQTDEDVVSFLMFSGRKGVQDINFFGLQYFPRVGITQRMYEQGHFSQAKYSSIMDGVNAQFTHLGGDVSFKEIIRFKIIALLYRLLPSKAVGYLVAKKMNNIICQVVPCWIVERIYNFFMHSYDQECFTKWKYKHYLYFMAKKILPR